MGLGDKSCVVAMQAGMDSLRDAGYGGLVDKFELSTWPNTGVEGGFDEKNGLALVAASLAAFNSRQDPLFTMDLEDQPLPQHVESLLNEAGVDYRIERYASIDDFAQSQQGWLGL